MACKQEKFPGKVVVIRYAIGCPDVQPTEGEWKVLGSMRTKELTYTWDTVDATDDASVGAIRENIATFMSAELSGDGTIRNDDGPFALAVVELEKHVANPVATGGQPTMWVQVIDPRLTRTFYALVGEFQPLSAPFDDLTTWSFTASASSSPFGLQITDTPDPTAPAVQSVNVWPETITGAAGKKTQLAVSIDPVGAATGVSYVSADPAVATVSPTGVVTLVATGSTTITVTSTSAAPETDTVTVTVT